METACRLIVVVVLLVGAFAVGMLIMKPVDIQLYEHCRFIPGGVERWSSVYEHETGEVPCEEVDR